MILLADENLQMLATMYGLKVSEYRGLGRMCKPKAEKITGMWRTLHN
jgi:hypothetical protein